MYASSAASFLRTRGRVSAIAAASSGILLAANLAGAATRAEENASPAEPGVGLEEIIVTARKRAEDLQETPVAITAFTAATLEARNFANLADVTRHAPNLIFDTGTGNTGGSANAQIFMRGVGQSDFLFASDPGVGIYVDEVYYPRAVGSVLELLDFERIEVLRGPQGTLFGKNTIGGAVSITTRRPGNELGGYVQAKVGSRDRLDGEASIDLPLSPGKLSARLTALVRSQDGYVRRTLVGDELGDVDSRAARLALAWVPAEGWDVRLSLDGTRRREGASPNELVVVRDGHPADLPLALWNLLVAPTYGPDIAYDSRYLSGEGRSNGTGPNHSDLDSWGTSLVVSRELENLTLKSISAYRHQHALFGSDQDHSPLRFTETTNDNEDEHFSQELQLVGSSINGRLDWVVGAFFFEENGSDVFDVALGAGLYDALEALPVALIPVAPGVTCPPPPGAPPLCAGGAGNPLNVPFDLEATFFDDIRIESYAAYTQATYAITDLLSVTAGARYTKEKKRFSTTLVRNSAGVVAVPPTTIDRDWSAVTPRIGFELRLTDDALAYVSASRGFKSGGFNGRATSVEEIDSFRPEYLWSYEVGLKSDWLDRRVRLNAAAFLSKYTDMQLWSLRDVGGLIVAVTENAGKSEIRGAELELTLQPTSSLFFAAGIGYTDAQYERLSPTATVTLDHRFPKIPEWTVSAAAQYRWRFPGGAMLTVGADASYRSSYHNELSNAPTSYEDGYTLLGAQVAFVPPSARWQLTAFGTNLTDARYIVNGLNAFGTFGTATADFGRPREWGLAFKLNF